MKERVGSCTNCQKELYCIGGFLNAVIKDDQLYCYSCDQNEKSQYSNLNEKGVNK